MPRNRVIYQSEALFVTALASGGRGIDIVNGAHTSNAVPHIGSGSIHQIHRVQSANYSFSIARQDVNQFGTLARIDTAVIEAPTVSLDFSYLLTDGTNEAKLGISADAQWAESAISGVLANASGRNYHILTVSEGQDANTDKNSAGAESSSTSSVISIGNGYITNYSVEGSVGGLPTASVSVEGLNIRSDTASLSMSTPSIDPSAGVEGSCTYHLPHPVTGVVGATLRPGDIQLNLGDPAVITDLSDGADGNSAHIQSFTIDVPLGRSNIQKLGNAFGFAREIDFPVTVNVGISAIVADLKAGTLFDELYAEQKHELQIVMRSPSNAGAGQGSDQIAFKIKNAQLESESFSSSIGDNKTVDLSFSATVGGPEDNTNGLFISGNNIEAEAVDFLERAITEV